MPHYNIYICPEASKRQNILLGLLLRSFWKDWIVLLVSLFFCRVWSNLAQAFATYVARP